MILLDSSIVVAAFRDDDTNHKKAKALLMEGAIFVVPDVVLLESLTVLKLKEGFERMRECSDFLRNNADITIRYTAAKEWDSGFLMFSDEQGPLSFVDTLLLFLHTQYRMPLATFDKALQKQLSA
jgi:predicted nucleic acid-binding protein